MRKNFAVLVLAAAFLGGCAGSAAFPGDEDQYSQSDAADSVGVGDSLGRQAFANGPQQHQNQNQDATAQVDMK